MLRFGVAVLFLASLLVTPAFGLITGGEGESVDFRGLPPGSLTLANLKTRIAWWEGPPFGGGQYHFDYSGTNIHVQAAITLFAKIDSERKRIVVRSEKHNSFWLGNADKSKQHPVDWQFVVWRPENWQHLRDANAGLLPPGEEGDQPKTELVVFVTDRIDWDALEIPAGLDVVDERLEPNGIAADKGAAIRGRVLDYAGNPVAAAKITVGADANQTSGTTDAKGAFLITEIPKGNHRIVVEGIGFASKDEYYFSFTQSTFKKLDVTLAKCAHGRVRVTDNEGKPLPGIKVRVRNCRDLSGSFYRVAGPQLFTSDANGEFVLNDVPEGTIKFQCSTQQYYYNSVLNEHATTESPIILKLQRTGSVKISVTTSDGKPVTSKYIVEITEAGLDPNEPAVGSWGGSARIGKDGTCTFKKIPPGSYEVTGKPNPGRVDDRTPPKTVQIKGADHYEIKLIAK